MSLLHLTPSHPKRVGDHLPWKADPHERSLLFVSAAFRCSNFVLALVHVEAPPDSYCRLVQMAQN
jgi:hypothetical protein